MLMPAEGSRTTCYINLFFDTHTQSHYLQFSKKVVQN